MVVQATLAVGKAEPGDAQTWQSNEQIGVILEMVNGKPELKKVLPEKSHKMDVGDIGGMSGTIVATDTVRLRIPSKEGVDVIFVGYQVAQRLGMRPRGGPVLPVDPDQTASDRQWAILQTMVAPTLSSRVEFTYWDWNCFKNVPKAAQASALKLSAGFGGPAAAPAATDNVGRDWSLKFSRLGSWFAAEGADR
jgi:hypothetical protein